MLRKGAARRPPPSGFDPVALVWDNPFPMKRAGVLGLALVFLACMVHFYYAEDHCPVHCPTRGGRVGHVHDHHAGAAVCLCFWASLFSPEADVFAGPLAFEAAPAPENETAAPVLFGADIPHPPKVLPV